MDDTEVDDHSDLYIDFVVGRVKILWIKIKIKMIAKLQVMVFVENNVKEKEKYIFDLYLQLNLNYFLVQNYYNLKSDLG